MSSSGASAFLRRWRAAARQCIDEARLADVGTPRKGDFDAFQDRQDAERAGSCDEPPFSGEQLAPGLDLGRGELRRGKEWIPWRWFTHASTCSWCEQLRSLPGGEGRARSARGGANDRNPTPL